MSASLVGSEMCIRDSLQGEQFEVVLGPRSQAPNACNYCALSMGRRSEQPVSYTHLTLPTICSV
eukprot:11110677-Alexandrium_andersonii.AAC.1